MSCRFFSLHYRLWSYLLRDHPIFTYHKFLQNLSNVHDVPQHLLYEHSYELPMVNGGILICCFLCHCIWRRPAKSCHFHHLQRCLGKILFCMFVNNNKMNWYGWFTVCSCLFSGATVYIDVNVNLRYVCYSSYNFNVFMFNIWRHNDRIINKIAKKVSYQIAKLKTWTHQTNDNNCHIPYMLQSYVCV